MALTKALNDLGWRTPIISLSGGPVADTFRQRGIEVVDLGLGPAPRWQGGLAQKLTGFGAMLAYQRTGSDAVARALRTLGADMLNVRLPNLVSLAGAAAKSADVTCIWQMARRVEKYPLDLAARYYRFICRRFGIVVLANSSDTARSLASASFVPTVVHLGADPRRFDPERVASRSRASLGIPEDAAVFGIFARMVASKGQARFLQAMLSLTTAHPHLHLLLVGGPLESKYTAEVRRLAETADASARLHLVGPRTDLETYYDAIDVAVNSRIDAEGFGLSVVEAMMMGRPVLVHANGGPAETVVDGVTGWHVSAPSVHSFARGIERALGDRAHWPRMGADARAHALEFFSIEAVARRYISAVQPALRATHDRGFPANGS
jgi:glycosyltransferase involved in cell wall biosynthesis